VEINFLKRTEEKWEGQNHEKIWGTFIIKVILNENKMNREWKLLLYLITVPWRGMGDWKYSCTHS
jgi:hypothetical protein